MRFKITDNELDNILYSHYKVKQFNNSVKKDLDYNHTKKLSNMLENENFEIISILEFYYLYNQTFNDIEEVLDYKNVEEKLKVKVIDYSRNLGLDSKYIISDKSLKEALYNNLNKNEIKVKSKKIRLLNKNAAIIAASLLIIFSSFITISSKNNSLDFNKTKINYEIKKDSINYSDKSALYYTPQYIPDNYELVSFSCKLNRKRYYYKFREDRLDSKNLRYYYIEIKNLDNNLKLYRDRNSKIEEIKIYNKTYYLISDDNINEIIFLRNNVFFSISGTLSRDELIKIATKIEYIQ